MVRILKNYFHASTALLANFYYQYPSSDMTVIGVTGTDGKTTTSSMIAHILSTYGLKIAVITTVGASINGHFYETGFHTTTPSSFFLQKYLSIAKKAGCTHAVIETTSHALDQHRSMGIAFKIGVITNITHEHLDYHKTFEKYMRAKSKLLRRSFIKLLNFDDPIYSSLIKYVPEKNRFYYSLLDKDSYVKPTILPAKIKQLGEFNMQNALAAASVCHALEIPSVSITKALSTFTLPEGRMEVVHTGQFQVIVDFAHTPNAFAKVLPEVKKNTAGRLIHIFGAAHKRDVTKRSQMGEESAKYADIIILTAEDPRGADVGEINEQIASGFSGLKQMDPNLMIEKENKFFVSIPDRKAAIVFAVSQAQPGDIIIITGKGHEKSMNIKGVEEPWSDKEAVFEALGTPINS